MISELIVGLVAGVAATLISAYLWPKINDRVTVRRILTPNDRDAEGFIELYDTLFESDRHRYGADELIEFMDASPSFGKDRIVQGENICLVARCHGDVVGILLGAYYRHAQKAIVGYYGIDKQSSQAKKYAAILLLHHLKRILTTASPPCEFILFELERPADGASAAEKRKPRSRAQVFRTRAGELGIGFYELVFPYTCPKVSISEEAALQPATLFCAPLTSSLPEVVPRATVLEWLRFVHKDCYGDLYELTDERYAVHHAHLDEALQRYGTGLPELVPIR